MDQKSEAPPEGGRDSYTRDVMQEIATLVDDRLPADWGFFVMAFPFNGEPGRLNYISNAKRGDVIRQMRGWIKLAKKNQMFSHLKNPKAPLP